jgi:hypothetical protein
MVGALQSQHLYVSGGNVAGQVGRAAGIDYVVLAGHIAQQRLMHPRQLGTDLALEGQHEREGLERDLFVGQFLLGRVR